MKPQSTVTLSVFFVFALLAFAAFMALPAKAVPAYTVTVQTDKTTYYPPSTIKVTGTVSPAPVPTGTSASIVVHNPSKTLVCTDSEPVNANDGSFVSTACVTGGTTNWVTGTYNVTASWWNGKLPITSNTFYGSTTFVYNTSLPKAPLTLSYSVNGGGTGFSAPVLTYVSDGNQISGTIGNTPTIFPVDKNSLWSVTNPLFGSSSSERWDTTHSTSGNATSPQTIAYVYTHQYSTKFGFSTSDGSTVSAPPTVNYTQFGSVVSNPAGTGQAVWVDAGASYSYQNPLSGSSSTQRWFATVTGGTVNSAAPVTSSYYHQYSVTSSYSVNGGGSPAAPTLTGTSTSSHVSVSLTSTAQNVWLDAGSTYSVTNPLTGSTTSERWMTNAKTNGTMSAAVTLSPAYYHQYLLTASYTVVSGGGPTAPTLTSSAFGSSISPSLSTSQQTVWVDAGAQYSVNQLLGGSSSTERWTMSSAKTASGTVNSASTLVFTYYHEFFITVQASPSHSLGGTVSPSNGWYNASASISLTATPKTGWLFEGWTGIGPGAYTGSQNPNTLSVAGAINETAVFFPSLVVGSRGSGSVTYSYGSNSNSVQGGLNTTIYVPSGTSVTLTASPSSFFYTFTGWSGALTGSQSPNSVSVTSPTIVVGNFGLNYIPIILIVVVVALAIVGVLFMMRRRRKATPKATT